MYCFFPIKHSRQTLFRQIFSTGFYGRENTTLFLDALSVLDSKAAEVGLALDDSSFYTAIYFAFNDENRRGEIWRRVIGI